MQPTSRKRLLILASKLGYQTSSFSAAAQKLGVEVIFATDRCHQLEDPWGDRAIPVHFERPQQAALDIVTAIHEAHEAPPDALLALGDRPTVTAAYVAKALVLEHNSPAVVEACRSKLRQREIFRAAGLPVPPFFSFSIGELPEIVATRAQFPCVIKPLSLSASQGVIRANSVPEFSTALTRIRRLLQSPELQVTREPSLDRLLVEHYIPGSEVALEGLLDDGNLRILAIFDKPDPLEGPFFEETIYVTPSRLPLEIQHKIQHCAQDAVRALGLIRGSVHAEFRINEQGPWILEVAPRPIGGLCSHALRFGPFQNVETHETQEFISLEELLVRHALGLSGADLPREQASSGVFMIPVPNSGVFEGVEGLDQARSTPGITELHITARVHDYIAAWPEGASYLGFIFARGNDPAGVESSLRAAHSRLRFHLAERLAVEHPALSQTKGASSGDH
ncbi:MAG TPA: ATP-grasp domain-containing protein [Candidatus Dormibacteraeota bacterium]|nr:ATP-grasp domain-containing protein [Candidatus Dormibacteraeota bacterium]